MRGNFPLLAETSHAHLRCINRQWIWTIKMYSLARKNTNTLMQEPDGDMKRLVPKLNVSFQVNTVCIYINLTPRQQTTRISG